MPSAISPLNWKEIARLVEAIAPQLTGLFVDRVIVPERPRFEAGFLKGEWALRLTGRRNEATFLFSVRARRPYFYLIDGKGPRAAPAGTHSAFDLSLSKNLKGRRVETLVALPRERFVVLWFAPLIMGQSRLGLVLNQIPALPEALLVTDSNTSPLGETAAILSRTRIGQGSTFEFPLGERSPEGLGIRETLVKGQDQYTQIIESTIDAEAFELRVRALARELRETVKHAADRARQNETALREAELESGWQRYGDLLKASLGSRDAGMRASESAPEREGTRSFWRVMDYETGELVEFSADPKLDARAQVERYYGLARRKRRRIEEARARIETFTLARARAEQLAARVPEPGMDGTGKAPDWPALESLEAEVRRLTGRAAPTRSSIPAPREKKRGGWLGKSFVSKDGMTVLAGRSKDENLELTFKHSRGNDVWMHVRGKPGAHIVIPIPSGKSATLETLLDAAALCIHYSDGANWGTTEVDYTFKKYVKRIKDSSEASYSNNKTLLVQPDQGRLKRLLGQG